MNALLTIYNTPAWEALANVCGLTIIEDALSEHVGSTLIRPVQKTSLLTNLHEQKTYWLGVVQAEYYIAYALENGSSIESAAARWREKTTELLSIQRQKRKQIKLFNIHQALCEPKKFKSALNEQVAIHNYLPHRDESSLALLAACQYVNQAPELKSLNVQLQASVIALLDSEELLVDVEYVLGIHRTQAKELAAVNEEYDQLLQQTQQIQELLNQKNNLCEQHEKKALSMEASLQNREARLKEAQLSLQNRDTLLKETELNLQESTAQLKVTELNLQESAAQLKATEEERDLILSQLHVVQEQLESYYLQLQTEQQQNRHALLAHEKQSAREQEKLETQLRKTKARAASTEYEKGLLEQEFHKIRSSIAWKSAAPIRAISRLGKKNDPAYQQLQQQIALLLTSEYFDVEWYLKHYPDVAESQMNPAEHYILYGAAEGRLPSLHFDGNWYLQQYPDIAAAGLNPLLHFIMFGQEEGRSSSPKLLNHSQGEA